MVPTAVNLASLIYTTVELNMKSYDMHDSILSELYITNI